MPRSTTPNTEVAVSNPGESQVIAPLTYQQAEDVTVRIKSHLMGATEHFLLAGNEIEIAYEGQVWKSLSRVSFTEYCELDLGVSDSLAYDLMRLHRLCAQFPDARDRIIGIGVSKARLLMSGLPYERATRQFNVEPGALRDRLDDAEELTWNDLRQRQSGDDAEPVRGDTECPHCHYRLTLSRRARIVDAQPPRRNGHTAPWNAPGSGQRRTETVSAVQEAVQAQEQERERFDALYDESLNPRQSRNTRTRLNA